MDIEQCIRCDNPYWEEQVTHWSRDGMSKLLKPVRMRMPYCWHYTLYLGSVERILSQDSKCPHARAYASIED